MTDSIAELIFRTFNDGSPAMAPDAAYLFGQTTCNQESSFAAALTSPAKNILLLDTLPRSGYPGYSKWREALVNDGLDADRIQPIPMDDELLLNTRTESQALINYVRRNGIRTLEVIAPPFHQLRAFMTTITIALEEKLDVRVYSRPGKALPWCETVVHSQGTLQAPRRHLIHEELARIETYRAKGDLADVDAILDYLNRRDARLVVAGRAAADPDL